MSFVVFPFTEIDRNRAYLITKLAKILDIRAMHAYDLACFDKKHMYFFPIKSKSGDRDRHHTWYT